MPPPLALLLTTIFCVVMIRRYSTTGEAAGKALWLPCIWIFFVGSRFPSQWMALLGISIGGGGAVEEGSPLDAVFFLVLIVIGIVILARRGIGFGQLARENLALALFFGFSTLAILWSDFPFVAIKRWIKTLGHPVMALVLLTEPRPLDAIRTVFKRTGFLMLSLSVMFIKYFPEYGRGFDSWTGYATNQGINLNKNELGYCCMIFGLFFAWNFVLARKMPKGRERRAEIWLSIGFLAMVFWLLKMAQSATSLVCLVIGSATLIGLGFKFIPKRMFGTYLLTVLGILALLETTVGLYKPTLELLGRDATLTDRTEVWADALALVESPLLGAGFESFWLGDRLKILWDKWWWQPNQAHNGYIETYLNLGAVGVGLLVLLIIATFRKITARFITDFDFARFRMAFLFVAVLYNFTEATFKAVHLVWTVFHLIALDVAARPLAAQLSGHTEDLELVSDDDPDNLTPPDVEPSHRA